ncbi:hypothetical protein [Clostridium saccharoperbutylacetonicum]|uniref:hypothetical protein n=1 Tax=Clostridium saccharoperbutylacetonicum TaxID=36745 RepID=UPI000983C3F1|nr:hypothetical protein [Clostridium saccharoperbutylacetonicum]AQR96624.1 hypothetical protein CLSAP_39480 [Clostridium saccharoperbutylacetonicum]NSB32500.1 hypothetical protein [Clostridium saccharoperbutylacetonicum]
MNSRILSEKVNELIIYEVKIMYYNNKFKILNISIVIIIILTAIFSMLNHELKLGMPILMILLGLQQLVLGINSLKLNKKKDYIVSIGVSIFIFACSIISIILIVS